MADVFCPSCGYNLFGLPRPVCPECGRDLSPILGERSLIPWVNATRWNWLAAFWRTVFLVTFRPRLFCCEVVRPVDWRVARRFAWLAAAQAWLTGPLLLAGLMWTGQVHREVLLGMFPLWLWIVLLAGSLPLCMGLCGVQTYFFHPRSSPPEYQERALALSWYAGGAWALAPWLITGPIVILLMLPRYGASSLLDAALPVAIPSIALAFTPMLTSWWTASRLAARLFRSTGRSMRVAMLYPLATSGVVAAWLLFLVALPLLLSLLLGSLK